MIDWIYRWSPNVSEQLWREKVVLWTKMDLKIRREILWQKSFSNIPQELPKHRGETLSRMVFSSYCLFGDSENEKILEEIDIGSWEAEEIQCPEWLSMNDNNKQDTSQFGSQYQTLDRNALASQMGKYRRHTVLYSFAKLPGCLCMCIRRDQNHQRTES